jgi:hypothetical protein
MWYPDLRESRWLPQSGSTRLSSQLMAALRMLLYIVIDANTSLMIVLDDNNSYVEPTHLMVTLAVVTT